MNEPFEIPMFSSLKSEKEQQDLETLRGKVKELDELGLTNEAIEKMQEELRSEYTASLLLAWKELPADENKVIKIIEVNGKKKFIIAHRTDKQIGKTINLICSDNPDVTMIGYRPGLKEDDQFESVTFSSTREPVVVKVMDVEEILKYSGDSYWSKTKVVFDLLPKDSANIDITDKEKRQDLLKMKRSAPLARYLIDWANDQVQE